MKLISHRGNINGPNPQMENNPSYVTDTIDKGYDVEIDLHYDGGWWLGHDDPRFQIDMKWIYQRSENLWIHCKNIESLNVLAQHHRESLNFFWHQNDDFTLTSRCFMWTYPNKPLRPRSVCVLPEQGYDVVGIKDCYGLCTDYLLLYSNKQKL
jgi:hypothetical protein